MRRLIASALLLAVTLPLGVTSAEAGGRDRSNYRRERDCTPYNGPFGFYGNIWCNPGEERYMRNLGAQWPQPVPPSLRYPKAASASTDW